MPIGIKLTPDTLVLTRGRDFSWTFANLDSNQDETDFPPGELFFEIYTDLEDPDIWDFDIEDTRATIKIEHTVCDAVPDRTRFQLVWLPDGEAAGGEVVSLGKVRVQL